MDFLELITEATGSLTLNKMRTALATLGIVIGTGSVISLVSLGVGIFLVWLLKKATDLQNH